MKPYPIPAIEAAWKHLLETPTTPQNSPQSVEWFYQLSLPFPQTWPAPNICPAVVYLYACGFDFGQLRDAVRTAGIWAHLVQSEISPDGWLLQIRPKGLMEIGIQGVRPLTASELNQPAPLFEDLWATDSSRKTAIRAYYNTWLELHGVIGAELLAEHAGFINWLKS